MTSEFPRKSHEFRRVLWTGESSQLVEMTIPVKGSGPEGRGEIGNGMWRREIQMVLRPDGLWPISRGAPRRPGEHTRYLHTDFHVLILDCPNSISCSLKASARPSLLVKSRSVKQEICASFLRELNTTVSMQFLNHLKSNSQPCSLSSHQRWRRRVDLVHRIVSWK